MASFQNPGRRPAARLLAVAVAALGVALAAAERTVWEGVFSAAQVQRGKAAYQSNCASCHADDLSGGADQYECVEAPPLKEEGFMEARSFGDVYEWVRDHMPPRDPAGVSNQAKLDALTYVFQQNGARTGPAEFTIGPDLKTIRITKKP
jgi:mono/diheme cytochrome c family protein